MTASVAQTQVELGVSFWSKEHTFEGQSGVPRTRQGMGFLQDEEQDRMSIWFGVDHPGKEC